MATIFSRIIAGEIPSYRIAEDEEHYAFLDINPYQLGHTLVVPKREVDYYYDLTDEELARLMAFSKRVARAIQEATHCRKVATLVLGLEVPHAHVHLIPINSEGDVVAHGPLATKPTDEEMARIASEIASYIK